MPPVIFWQMLGFGVVVLCVGKAVAMIVMAIAQARHSGRASVSAEAQSEAQLMKRLSSVVSPSHMRPPVPDIVIRDIREPAKVQVPIAAADLPRPRRQNVTVAKGKERVRDRHEG